MGPRDHQSVACQLVDDRKDGAGYGVGGGPCGIRERRLIGQDALIDGRRGDARTPRYLDGGPGAEAGYPFRRVAAVDGLLRRGDVGDDVSASTRHGLRRGPAPQLRAAQDTGDGGDSQRPFYVKLPPHGGDDVLLLLVLLEVHVLIEQPGADPPLDLESVPLDLLYLVALGDESPACVMHCPYLPHRCLYSRVL